MKNVGFLTGVALLAACSAELPHEAPFDSNAPLEKQAKASLAGTIRLEGETDFSQVTLDLQNESRTYNVDTEADGAVSLTGIVPGEYALKIRTRYFQAVTETLTIDLAEKIDLGTRTLTPLRGRVLGLATSERVQGTNLVSSGGVQLALRKTASIRSAVSAGPAFRPAADATTAAAVTLRTVSGVDGSFEFNEVQAGGYTLFAASTETGERAVGSVTVTGEGDLTVDPIVLRPLTGYFEILGTANGVPSSTYTSIAAVNLQLQQSNAVQVKVAVSTDGTTATCDLSTATPEALPSNTLRPLTFTSEGKKLVCVSYIDADGKETEPIYGSITYDATAPTLPSLAINGGAQVVGSNLVTLSISAVDTLSGVAVHKVHGVNDFSAVSPKPYQPTDVYSLTTGDGLKTVWVTFGDHAGNYSAPVSASVVLDTTVPVVNSFSLTRLNGTPLTTGDTIAESRIKLVSSVSEAGLEMQISTNGSFAGQPWVPYDPAKSIDLPDGASSISVRVRDGAGHVVDVVTAFALSTDTTPPTGTLTIAPTAVTDPVITVTASGSADAIEVELAFDPGFVTTLGRFTPGPIAVNLIGGDGTKTIYGRFYDAAGNASALVGDTVTLDTTPPQILSYTLAQASPTKDNPVTVQYSVAGAAELRVAEGAACGGSREAVGAGSKTFTVSASEGNKEIRLQFFDAAGNASECAVRTVYYDPNPPVVGTLQINYGQAATSSNVVTLSFPGVSGASKVMASEDPAFAGADWQTYAATKAFVLSSGNGVKTVYAKVADDAGHVVNVPQATITLDTSMPTAPSIFAAVEVTTQTSVLLTLAAGVVQDMWLTQDDPNFTTGAWEPYVGSKVFMLSGADGTKTIYAKFRKSTGIETAVVSDTVILDRAAPTLPSVRVDSNAAVVSSASVVLNLSAVDAASGLATFKINTINDFDAVSAQPFQSNVLFGLGGPDGLKPIWVTIGDKAGQFSAPVSTSVLLDTADPVVNSAVVRTAGGTPLTTGATIADTRVVLATNVTDLSALQMQVSTSGSFAGAVWETYNPTKSIDLPAGTSTIIARVRDAAGHESDLLTSFAITVDNTPPTSPSLLVNAKIAGAVSTATVSVTLSASGDAIDAELAYDPGFVTSLGSFAPNATHNVPLLAGDGSKSLYVRFFDAAGNASALAGDTVILDTTPPIASFTIAEASPTKTNPLTLHYTQSGATELRLAEGATCGGPREAVGSGTKAFSVSSSEGSKEVRLQFFDAVGNASACLLQSVYFDPNPPVVGALQINYGQAATSSNVVTLSFPGVSGATKVMVSEDAAFTGADWQTFAVTKTFTLSAGNGVKTVYAKVADDAGHVVSLTQQSITLDTTPPTSPSIFAAYDVTSQTTVMLFLSAGLVSEMWITQDDPTFTTGAWETYSGTKLFALTGTDGTKTLYAKFKKSTGVETSVVSDTVVLDRTAPILPSVQINGGVAVVSSSIVTLSLSAVDTASGLATYKINTTNDFSAISPKPFQQTDVFSFAAGDGVKTVWVTIGDHAGNYSAPVSAMVLLDSAGPVTGGTAPSVTKLDGTPLTSPAVIAESRVKLTSSLTDLSSLEMQIATDGVTLGKPWVPYEAGKIIDLPSGTSTLVVRVRDAAGNVVELLSGFTITTDTTPPAGTLTIAAAAVTDPAITVQTSGSMDAVEVELAFDPGFVTSLGRFTPGPIPITLPLGDGTKTVYGRFFDAAGNTSALVGDTVMLDTTPPQILSYTIAQASPTKDNPVTVNYSASGAAELRITEGAECGGARESVGAGTKSFTVSAAEGVKEIRLQFFDAAGNASECAVRTVYYDPNPPVIGALQINYGQAATSSNIVTLSFPGVSGATKIMVSEDAGFSGADWQSFSATKTFTLSPGNGVKTVYGKVADDAGHVVNLTEQSITLDTTPPTNPSIFAAYDVTSQTSVTLFLSAGLVSEMWITQDDPAFTTGAWETYSGTKLFALTGTDGTKTIYAKFKKSTGVETSVVSDTVVLDRTAPILPSLQVNGGASVVTSNVVTLNLSAVDAASGVATYMVNDTNDFAALSPKPYQTSDVYALSGGDGAKTVWVVFGDRAGHFSAPVSTTVLLDTTPPSAGSVAVTKLDGTALMSGGTVTENRVLLTSTVSDASALEMQVTTNGSYVGVAWVPYEPAKVIDLVTGTPTISARVRDGAGLVANLLTAFTLTVDTVVPTLAFARTSAAITSSLTVNLSLSANEASEAQVSESALFSGAVWFPTANTSLTLPAGDGVRTIYARARDTAGNFSSVMSVTVQIDTVAPSGAVLINQGAAATVTNVVTLQLSGVDSGSGIDGVKLADSLAGLAAASVVPMEATKPYTLGGAAGPGVEEAKTVWMQVVDRAGLTSPAVSDEIRFDRKNPTGSIALSSAVTKDTLVGVDLTFDADVTHMKLSAGNACAGGNWVEASTETVFTLPGLDGAHYVSVRFRDGVLNESTCYSTSVVLDRAGPTPQTFTVTGNAGASLGYSDTPNVAIDAGTAAGDCAYAELAEDVGFISPTATGLACSLAAQPYALTNTADGFHTLYLRYFDTLGNPGPVTGATLVLDTADPQVTVAGGFTIAQGAYTNNPAITLQLAAAGATKVAFGEGAGCAFSPEAYLSTKSLTLSGGDGAKTVSVRYSDDAGNATPCYARQVTLDSLAPAFSAAIAGAEAISGRTAQQVVTLVLSGVAADAVEMMVSSLSGFIGADWFPVQTSSLHVLPPGDGSKVVYVKLRDRAGNESVVNSPSIVLDQTPPDAVAIALTDIDDDGFVLKPDLVELGWSSSADPNAVQFELERLVMGTDSGFQQLATLSMSTVLFGDDISATAGVVHQYRVRVLDDLGRASQWSNVLGVYTMAADPMLCWSVDQVSGASVALRLTPPKGAVSVSPTYARESLPIGATIVDSYPANQLTINLGADFSTLADGKIDVVSENQDGLSRVLAEFPLPYGFRRTSIAANGYESAVLVGPDGTVHVGFYAGDMMYMKNVGGVWSAPVAVDTVNTTGRMPSIGLDANGYVHLSYYDWTTYDLRYVNNVGGAWNAPVSLDTAGDVGQDSSLAVDASGNVHIAYWDSTTYYVKYVTNAGGWQAPVPLGATGNVASPALVLDAAGNVHITYEGPTAKLMYVHNVGGLWSVPDEATPIGGRYSALMIDDLGFAHVAFQNPSAPPKIQYVDNTAGVWGTPVDIGTSGNGGWGLSMVYDNDGNGKVVWLDSAGFDLRYAISVTGTWGTPMILDGVGEVGEGNSISVDAFGNAHVTYYDRTNNMLRYAVEKRAGFTAPVAVQTASLIGQHPSIAAADDGVLHVSYFNYTTKTLMYVKKTGAGWGAPEPIDYTGLAPQLRFSQSSLAVDSNGDAHVSYFDITSEDLKYANNIGGAWNAPVVLDSTGTVGEQNSLSIDGNGDIHIAYTDGTNYAVKYVNNAGGSWNIPETVASNSYDPDLMADSAGDVHVAYRLGWPSADLLYVKRTGAAWGTPQVVDTSDTSASIGYHTVLALDASNKVHVAYYAVDTSALKYANNVSDAWSAPQLVDAAGDVGQQPAMSVSASGVVHVAYYDATNGDLKYLRHSSGRWTAPMLLDSAGNVGEYPSLVLDTRGDAHVAYYDHTNFDLKYKRIGEAEVGCAAPDSSASVGAF